MSLQFETDAVRITDLSLSYSAVVEVPPEERTSPFARRTKKRLIHALNDVSFSVPAGKAVALIGGNGAGKSTLMKAMVGALKPSSGRIDLWGRAHLLAPGMGFNRKLSGRENVLLGGLAAGMSLAEVREKQEAIIEFADIGGFIDMPTTTYSSGMFGRLAFAVATHVDPEILLIDEALSAGDAGFRDRAVNRVQTMCAAARTIIVVSHSTALVAEMATEAIWLHQGSVRQQGEVNEVADAYLEFQTKGRETAQLDRTIADR
jgi:teichoic acid transport system ATP-binding protein